MSEGHPCQQRGWNRLSGGLARLVSRASRSAIPGLVVAPIAPPDLLLVQRRDKSLESDHRWHNHSSIGEQLNQRVPEICASHSEKRIG